MHRRVVAVSIVVATTAASFARPPRATESGVERTATRILQDGIAALGGADAIRAVHGVRVQYAQEVANKGQEEWPGAPTPTRYWPGR